MTVTIKSWRDGSVLYVAEGAADVRSAVGAAVRESANLRSASLGSADLRSANLGYADLGYADLRSADLRYANLRYANLGYADLRYASLGSADLRYAKGLAAERVNDLLILLDQPGKIRAYKLVNAAGEGPFNGGVHYGIGQTVEAKANTDPLCECGPGINLATLPWCLSAWRPGFRILVVEFTKKDIAAIPIGDGKFRVHRCKVIAEKKLDLVALGLEVEMASRCNSGSCSDGS